MTENIICALIAAGASIIGSGLTFLVAIIGLNKTERVALKVMNGNFEIIKEDFNCNYNNYTRDDLNKYNTDYDRRDVFLYMMIDCGLKDILEDLLSREYKMVLLKYLTKEEYKQVRACSNMIVAGLNTIKNLNINDNCYETRYLHYQDVYTALGNTFDIDKEKDNLSLKTALEVIKAKLTIIYTILNKKRK